MKQPVRIDQPGILVYSTDGTLVAALHDGGLLQGANAAAPALRAKLCNSLAQVIEALNPAGTETQSVAVAVIDMESAACDAAEIEEMRRFDPLLQLVLIGTDPQRTRDWFETSVRVQARCAVLDRSLAHVQCEVLCTTLVELWRREHELRRSQARLAAAERVSDAGHWEWSPSADQARWCNQFSRVFDLPPGPRAGAASLIWDRIHPDDRLQVRNALGRAAQEQGSRSLSYRIRLSDGSVRSIRQESVTSTGERDGGLWIVACVRDVTDDQSVKENIRKLAYFDPLTELPNRSFMNEYLNQILRHARRHTHDAAILHVDIDNFNSVNDTLGTGAGDRVLREVAYRLESLVRDPDGSAADTLGSDRLTSAELGVDTVARFGADEFIVILSEVADVGAPARAAERIVEKLRAPMEIDGKRVPLTASIGIATFPEHAQDEDMLLRNASLAMHAAKREGRNTWRTYNPDMTRPRMERLHIEARLREAVERGNFELHFQPKVNLATGELAGAEALLRWSDPELGCVLPSDFIPIAEECGLICTLGEWVMNSVCAQLSEWKTRDIQVVPVSVNVSARQLQDRALPQRLARLLRTHGIDASEFEVEITESVLMKEGESNEARLRELRTMGCTVSLDDFGTGYSSLSYLKRLPIDVVKIDRAFVRDILEEPDDQAILRAIIAMAHQLRLLIVAEGVETQEQLDLLRDMRCDLIQGYVESRPLTADRFAQRYLHRRTRLAS